MKVIHKQNSFIFLFAMSTCSEQVHLCFCRSELKKLCIFAELEFEKIRELELRLAK